MRRYWVLALAAVTLLGMLAPPAQAQAPATKVTITGFINSYMQAAHNLFESNLERPGDSEWSTHTRARFFFNTEVGKAKGVLGLEFDSMWGQVSVTDNNLAGQVAATNTQRTGSTSGFDLGVDTQGSLEVKHLYTQFPVPLVPFDTTMTLGAHGVNVLYKGQILLTDDLAGVTWVSTLAPNVKWHFTYGQIEENLTGGRRGAALGLGRGDDFVIVTSAEVTPMKGLDLRPVYSYFYAVGGTSGSARQLPLGLAAAAAGSAPTFISKTVLGAGQHQEHRHTFGIDARWQSGPWALAPTFLYQVGTRDTDNPFVGPGATNAIRETDLRAWIVDIEGGYRIGPVLLTARYVYTPGNRPMDQLSRDTNYYQPISSGSAYMSGWGDIFADGQVDIFGGSTHNLPTTISFERYGRQQIALRSIYSVTPAIDLDLGVTPLWTARSVDTDGTKTTATGGSQAATFLCATHSSNSAANPRGAGCRGDESYVGTDASFRVIWRFAPGLEFRWGAAYLFAGDALDISEVRNGVLTKRSGKDAYYTAAQVGYKF